MKISAKLEFISKGITELTNKFGHIDNAPLDEMRSVFGEPLATSVSAILTSIVLPENPAMAAACAMREIAKFENQLP